MIKIEFATSNAAFEDCPEVEIARILRNVADRVDQGEDEGAIIDANGNKVGAWTWTLDGEVA